MKNLGRFGFKIAMSPIFMKFGTHNKLNIPIMDIILPVSRVLTWSLAQNDYRLRWIIGCKIWLTVRTLLTAFIPC